jgi:23S rRNA (guanosine2251-2'-O)-methyltransferase
MNPEGAPGASALVIGRQPVVEALREGRAIDRIYLQRFAAGDIIPEIQRLAAERRIPVNVVPAEKLRALTRGNHQGVAAVTALVTYADLQQTIDHLVAAAATPLFLMLDGVTDIRNIGAISRSARCFGAQALIIPDKGVGALNEDAVKASAGALLHIAVARVPSLLKAVDTLHLNGFTVLAGDMRAPQPLSALDLTGPACLILGSEDKGIQPYLLKAADARFRIPMAAGFDSLNVSVSAGIMLHEAFTQRHRPA